MTKTCVVCGKEFARHLKIIMCSDECRKIRSRQQCREYLRKKRGSICEMDCLVCGKHFRRGAGETRPPAAKTCSEECASQLASHYYGDRLELYRDRARQKHAAKYRCECPSCGKEFNVVVNAKKRVGLLVQEK